MVRQRVHQIVAGYSLRESGAQKQLCWIWTAPTIGVSFYHGYYRSHILHPLLIFDG